METNNPEEDDYLLLQNMKLRNYQMKLIEDAKRQNSIVFLPPNSGKTLIAIHILSTKMSEVLGDFPEKAKRVFFVSPTKVLVYQLHKIISIHTKFKAQCYTGDMLLDNWNKEKWMEDFKTYQVLVLTGEILRHIIELKFITPRQISLIVFDECHHATLQHPYQIILQYVAQEPLSTAPLVLGLSAVLLNANPKKKDIPSIVHNLKKSFRGIILTTEDLTETNRFAVSPQEKLIPYKLSNSLVKSFLPFYDEVINKLNDVVLIPKELPKIPTASKPYRNQNRARRLKNWFVSARQILEDCGIYCGALAVIFYIILVEKLRLISTNAEEIQTLVYCRTVLHKLRHILVNTIGEETPETIFKYSSHKIQILLNLLCTMKNSGNKLVSTLIFVRQKTTAITVATLLKRLKEIDSNFSFLDPEFVIGSTAFYSETLLHELDNEQIIKEFASKKLNTLVSTNVLEEGIDISSCNLVISFDFPPSYASYLQTRGRARDRDGVYAVFVQEEEMENKNQLLNEYKQIEEKLYEVLFEDQGQSNNQEILSLYDTDSLTSTVIKAVYRYCGKLPQDKYSFLSPTAWYTEVNGGKKASVLLPMSSPIRDVIEGEVNSSARAAKKSAFLEVLKKLKEIGEIDENLNPVPLPVKAQCFSNLFPHFKNEEISDNSSLPGTRKRRQIYEVQFASALSECLPQPEQKVYLHVIDFAFSFQKVEREDKSLIQEVLQSPVTFAILSSKKLCKICQFPMFLDMAHITCNLLINYEEIVLSKSELDDIKLCHFAVFQKVLRITKSSQVFDNTNKGHSFYVAPVKKNEAGRFDLDWEIIRCDFCIENKSALVRYNPFNNQNIKRNVYGIGREMSTSPILEQVSKAMVPIADEVNFCRSNTYEESDQEPAFMMSEAEYKYFVISPNYRNIHPPQMYIVSKICYDLSPISPFPKSVYADYRAYYQDKYLIRITNPRQPLLKVANVFNCSNFNNPKCQGTQEKLKAVLKNHEELLVPELCDIVPFDRKYWLKALLLPTALNRICHMYCVEEFRRKIVNETGLGEVELPPATEWKPLGVDFTVTRSENEKADVLEPLNVVLPLSQLKNETTVVADFIDPKRNILEFSVCDMEYIVNFLGNVKSEEEIINSLSLPPEPDNDALIELMKTSEISVPPLSTIKTKESKLGPDLAQLFQAFTSTSANDVINYERLEILGDSFLKFAGSMFLYKHFRENEGILSLLKGKLVGNRNLLYCGLAKGFQNVLNITDFNPLSDWNPPLLCLPEKLVEAIKLNNTDSAVIYRWEIPSDEQFSGNLSDETIAKNVRITESYEKACGTPTNSLLPYKSIGDKTISDAVEAVLGTYLQECGVAGALEILMWLDILPRPLGSFSQLFATPLASVLYEQASVMNILSEIFYSDLEERLGYQFKNKGLLLEAITHPSYTINRATDCYQRLEFLGDAVLDFLITSYIYEYCKNLTPGEVTDIRASLVNNITFASLSVRYGFHKYLLKLSSRLNKAIEEFVTYQANKNYVIDDNMFILLEESDCLIAEAVQVPKALGDVFESLAGAIFLDSGYSLETVWAIYYRLMKREIDTFTKTVPKNPVRLLYEICEDYPIFEISHKDETVSVSCTAWYDNNEIKTYGIGTNKKEAKRSAAKLAIKKISELKK